MFVVLYSLYIRFVHSSHSICSGHDNSRHDNLDLERDASAAFFCQVPLSFSLSSSSHHFSLLLFSRDEPDPFMML